MARQAIEEHLLPGNEEKVPVSEISASLRTLCGAFVSLYVNNELRGCIGTFSEKEKLYVECAEYGALSSLLRFKVLPH